MSRRAMAVVVVGVLALSACGGDASYPTEAMNKRNEITALWTQIRDWRREDKIGLDPLQQDVFLLRDRPVPKRVCEATPQVPRACDDTCNLSDAICDNAERICIIAGELGPTDDWAHDKCASAKASCKEAQQHCCECGKSASRADSSGDSLELGF